MKTAEKTKFIKTCSICGEQKTDFCQHCQDQIAKDDGLLVNVCMDCCRCHEENSSITNMDKLISEPGRKPVYMCNKCGVFHTGTHTCQPKTKKNYKRT